MCNKECSSASGQCPSPLDMHNSLPIFTTPCQAFIVSSHNLTMGLIWKVCHVDTNCHDKFILSCVCVCYCQYSSLKCAITTSPYCLPYVIFMPLAKTTPEVEVLLRNVQTVLFLTLMTRYETSLLPLWTSLFFFIRAKYQLPCHLLHATTSNFS